MTGAVLYDRKFVCGLVTTEASDVYEQQRNIIIRYDADVQAGSDVYVMPTLEGYVPNDYVRHIDMYGKRLTPGMWVGVRGLSSWPGDLDATENVLLAIYAHRPDLKLHGFGLIKTAHKSGLVEMLLHTAD